MSSLLSSLNMTANTLSVNEKAISVVSHNVANMNTEGYHKQRVNFATRNIAGAIGDNVNNQIRANGGVKIANVMRYNDEYLNNYYRTQTSELSKLASQLDGLKDLASILDDLEGTGIDSALSDFYEAVNKRRTTRQFLQKEVDFEAVKRILEAGNRAPTWDHNRN